MQNKFLYQILCISFMALMATTAVAQEEDMLEDDMSDFMGASSVTGDPSEAAPDLTGRQAVDFPARTSMDSLELAPLPGLYETNFTGPAPMAPSVSPKDMPSERLLGRLTPEVFQEMAEIERQNTFLKLQLQKEKAKKDLEDAKSLYRQARLEEISKREAVVRTRIQWWQEQEKIRQDLEAQRLEAENLKNEKEEKKLDQDILKPDEKKAIEEAEKEEPNKQEPVVTYKLVNIMGINGVLNAKIKNAESGNWAIIKVGDILADGTKVKDILPTKVVLTKNGKDTSLMFEDK